MEGKKKKNCQTEKKSDTLKYINNYPYSIKQAIKTEIQKKS